ncbi:DNA mismatch repair protein MutS [Halosimplex pelagicum]|uniref:DNA mismatch repair protein MutS n=1 Tax=Halosimplex pelagicum TaxID=869886 RepID=A0A7D5PAD3_9EURY|nr:DNA mismatch repair protein MutS [Halosimplex pelagicum]QLH82884.1 DNA mismatch repair protein MutS [Halosimplex pelagicum]
MDAALGAPAKMAEREDDLTPMMAQYFELCREYDDSLVLFQVGDFYEAFCEAAERVARICEITLTKREDSTGEYAMSGIPIDNAESYIERLLEAGYRVAVADQVEDPDEVSGVVDRAVTRVVTPGTLTEDELLRSADNNYVACLTADGPGGDVSTRDTGRAGGGAGAGGDEHGPYGLALLDVSTGDCYATGADRLDSIADELGRFAPAEAIVGPDAPADVFDGDCMVSPYERTAFDAERARERVEAYFGDLGLADEAEVRACGALLAYAEYTRGGNPDAGDIGDDSTAAVAGPGATAGGDDATGEPTDDTAALDYINTLTRYDPREYMLLDRVALESLELFDRRAVHGDRALTLVDALDETACALGRRKLDDWLRRPLLDEDRIAARHDAVAELTGDVTLREELHDLLDDVYDIERLVSRVARGRATARDLRSLHDTLAVVPDVEAALADADSATLVELREHLDPLADVRELIDEAIQEDPDADLTEGGIVKPDFDDELAELRATEREGKSWIDDLEASERERTGIDSLKVGHTSVHGYYIEVTDPNLDAVPDDYQRRQTLKNSERFVTPELREREDEIIRAEGRADDLEYELFCEVRRDVAEESERVQALADRLARLDVFVSFASVAAKFDYTRPCVGAEEFAVEAGRHPVVERTEERFVPNDAHFDDEHFFAVVTGPNMSGKSTYMRQVALTSVLAQAGSFVPAAAARLPVVDRVFTRVGASDDIAGGRSTFMVEMTELADILNNATEDSLVLLDEVGRGTSTADGLAIARAVTEHVHDEVGATTLFATHHHELTAIADELSGVFNLHFETEREDGDVAFEHEVAPGAAAASYGIEVAKLAGVPAEVVDRSRELLDESDPGASGEPGADANGHDPGENVRVSSTADERASGGDGGPTSDLERRLAALDVATMTPLEAMNALAELKESLDE